MTPQCEENIEQVVIDLFFHKIWHLSLPTLPVWREDKNKDLSSFLTTQIPIGRDFPPLSFSISSIIALPIRHWVHILSANIIFGIFGETLRLSQNKDQTFFEAPMDGLCDLREYIIIGKNCRIDPSAIIIGPTIIGDNVNIEGNCCVSASVIGDDSFIGQGCNIRLSVIGERVVFPAASGGSCFWSVVNRESLINSAIRFSVIGKNVFIGNGALLTDRTLKNEKKEYSSNVSFKGRSVKVFFNNDLYDSGYWVLGPAIGNNSKIGSGVLVYPGRAVAPNSIIYSNETVSSS